MSTIGVIGTPPMKATARTIAHITIADPRSPCTRHAPAAQAATRAIGRRLRRTSASTSWRRTSRSAQNSTSASLRNSDGCRLNEPTVTQARASLMVAPTDGTNGSAIPAAARAASGIASRRTHDRCMRMAISIPTSPKPAQVTCRPNTWYGLLPFADSTADDADSTITSPSITNTATTMPMT